MTRDRQLDDVLREWVDLGEERLPQHNLAAALAAVETTSQRSAGGALLEGLLMRFRPLAVPLGIAAVLLLAFGAFALVSRPPSVGPQPTPTLPEATQVDGTLTTSRFAVPLSLSMDAAPDPGGWFVTEGESVIIIGPTASSAGQSQLVILDPAQALIVDRDGSTSPLPADLVAWLNAQAGISAGPLRAFDAEEQESYPIAGQDIPVFSVEIDPAQAGRRVLVETDEGPILSVTDADANWSLLPFDRDGSDLILVLTSDAQGERPLGGSYIGMATSIELR
jgi:hypothetical protein